jgi:hypothetical protein
MPAVTRNQMKNSKNSVVNAPIINLVKDVVPIRQCAKGISYANKPNEMTCAELVASIKSLLTKLSLPFLSKETRIIYATTIYSLLNKEMMKHEKFYNSNKFVLTLYNKSFELENQAIEAKSEVDKNLLKKLITELTSIRPVLEGLITNMEENISYQSYLDKASLQNNICNKERPKRNIKRVNYAGMDMTSDDEGEICVFKPWFEDGKLIEKCFKRPLSKANELDDEDYIFEEDEDDEEDEDEEEQETNEQFYKRIWAKIHPETTPMTRRTRKQVDYSGMDMTSEDIGEICVFKPWFQDGKVIEKCFKRSLSKANELDDEDYIFEEVEEY